MSLRGAALKRLAAYEVMLADFEPKHCLAFWACRPSLRRAYRETSRQKSFKAAFLTRLFLSSF